MCDSRERERPATCIVAISLVVAACSLQAADDGKNAGQPGDAYEVRQGGYVEKVDPTVDYKDRLPRMPPRSPAESLKSFQTAPGMQIQLVAAEPLVADAVDLAFDENGQLYVAEMIPYAEGGTLEVRLAQRPDFDLARYRRRRPLRSLCGVR